VVVVVVLSPVLSVPLVSHVEGGLRALASTTWRRRRRRRGKKRRREGREKGGN